jgi:hypothetical protein
LILFSAPSFDQYFGLVQRVNNFPIEQFVSQLVVEALDKKLFCLNSLSPVRMDLAGGKFRPLIRMKEDKISNATLHFQIYPFV